MKYGSTSPRVRLFRNDMLERMTLVSPPAFALTWAIYLSCGVYASWGTTSLPMSVVLFVVGVLIWIFFEYAMHRFLFHLKLRSTIGRWLIFLTHGNHHAVPGDSGRNIMPPLVSVGISGSLWILFCLVLGDSGSVVFLGFGVGYVVYDTIHYACHQLPMRGPVLGRLRRHHIRHHCAEQEGNYAITAIFLDRVFGTNVPARR